MTIRKMVIVNIFRCVRAFHSLASRLMKDPFVVVLLAVSTIMGLSILGFFVITELAT